MPDRTTNLLPPERMRSVAREYYVRLGVVIAVVATLLVVAAAALLLPTYAYLSASAAAKSARLASIEAALASSDEAALSARLTALARDTKTLMALKTAPAVSATMRAALAVPHTGISLSGLEYAAPAGDAPGMLAIAGSALTRDALRSYQLALQDAAFSATADLPVSAYARDADIPFVITVTLAP